MPFTIEKFNGQSFCGGSVLSVLMLLQAPLQIVGASDIEIFIMEAAQYYRRTRSAYRKYNPVPLGRTAASGTGHSPFSRKEKLALPRTGGCTVLQGKTACRFATCSRLVRGWGGRSARESYIPKCFLRNSRPDPLFRYLSNRNAVKRLANVKHACRMQGCWSFVDVHSPF